MQMLYGTPSLACMPRGKPPRNFFNITPQTLQAHPKYLWGVWVSMDERMFAIVRVDASFTYPAGAGSRVSTTLSELRDVIPTLGRC